MTVKIFNFSVKNSKSSADMIRYIAKNYQICLLL